MSTSRRAWQQCESRAAEFFGARRRVLSGSANRGDLGGDDSTHDVLYIESKLRASSAVRTLHAAVKRRAGREKKVPVVALFDKHKHGFLLCVHSDDFKYVAAQFIAVLDPDEQAELDFLIEQARTRRAPTPLRTGRTRTIRVTSARPRRTDSDR